MIHGDKKNVLGILVNVVDYEGVADYVVHAARARRHASITALAVHGVMTGVLDRQQKHRLNRLSIVAPDGQPVRWALNWLHHAQLKDRCYGPNLTLHLCQRAEKEALPVFFYGATENTLAALRAKLLLRYPRLIIAGMEASKFRRLSYEEKSALAERICNSGAALVFVGLGCPRQEVFVYEFADLLPLPLIAVGAAFTLIAGEVSQAPRWIQDIGMEWFFRMCMEPKRLWSRYLLLNPIYVGLLLLQLLGLRSYETNGVPPTSELLYG